MTIFIDRRRVYDRKSSLRTDRYRHELTKDDDSTDATYMIHDHLIIKKYKKCVSIMIERNHTEIESRTDKSIVR